MYDRFPQYVLSVSLLLFFECLELVLLCDSGYVLSRPKSKLDAVEQPTKSEAVEAQVEKEIVAAEPKPVPVMATPVAKAVEWVPATKPVVSPEQQREVLQWVLQEKRKVKPQDKREKARIDEEKRLLKELLRGSQLPTLSWFVYQDELRVSW